MGDARDTPVQEERAHSPRADLGASEEPVRDDVALAAPERGRVLLLDDDPTLREIITAFLTENGYGVVPVQNGGEGVREVLANDFALVICDFNMPGLPGDMFYRAVERIRPELCNRFIFITGHRDDAKTNDFLRRVNGFVLWKPFPLQELQDAITLQEVRCVYQTIFDSAEMASAVKPDANVLQTTGTPHAEEPAIAVKVAAIVARAQTVPVPKLPLDDRRRVDSEARAGGVPRGLVLAGLLLLLVLGGRAWNGYADAREHAESASARRLELQARWSAISPNLNAVIAVRSKIATDEKRVARLSADRANPRWTTVLRSAEPGIEILEIHARLGLDDSGIFEARIRGSAGGPEPRLLADRFLHAVEKKLSENAQGRPVRAHFEELADEPGRVAEDKRIAFVMIATMSSMQPSVVRRREEH